MLRADETLETIEANKVHVINKLKENQERHIKEYHKALAAYKAALSLKVEEFRERLIDLDKALTESLQNDEPAPETPHLYFDLEPPDDHRLDYERVIGMLEMSVKDTVRVTATQWAAYVQDDWSWKKQFAAKLMTYSR